MVQRSISGGIPGNISAEIPFAFEMRMIGDAAAEISDTVFLDAAVSMQILLERYAYSEIGGTFILI